MCDAVVRCFAIFDNRRQGVHSCVKTNLDGQASFRAWFDRSLLLHVLQNLRLTDRGEIISTVNGPVFATWCNRVACIKMWEIRSERILVSIGFGNKGHH